MAKGYKTGGRMKGTPNKTTAEIRQIFTDLLCHNIDTLQTDLEALEPRDRVKALMDISRYVLPTLKAVETQDQAEGKNEMTINVVYADGIKPV